MVAMSMWPTESGDGALATDGRWRKMARGFATSGVIMGVSSELAPSLIASDLNIQPGIAWVDGALCELANAANLGPVTEGLAVVRFDPAANTADLLWREGVTAPTVSLTGPTEIPVAKMVQGELVDARHLVHPTIAARAVAYDATAPWYQTIQPGLTVDRPGMSAWLTDASILQGEWIYDGTEWIKPGLAGTTQLSGHTYVLAQSAARFFYWTQTAETEIGWFNLPLNWKIGDRCRLTMFGTLQNIQAPAQTYWLRLYLHNDVACGQLQWGPPQDGQNRRGWFASWDIHQEAAGSVWVRGHFELSANDANIESQGDPLAVNVNAVSIGNWVHPNIDTLVGYPVRMHISTNVAPGSNDFTAHGWVAEHLVA